MTAGKKTKRRDCNLLEIILRRTPTRDLYGRWGEEGVGGAPTPPHPILASNLIVIISYLCSCNDLYRLEK